MKNKVGTSYYIMSNFFFTVYNNLFKNQMSYKLRSRRIREELLVEDQDDDEVTVQSESEPSSNEEGSSFYTSEEDPIEEEDVDMEDASLHQRLLGSRARGRPTSKLKGKNGFVWNTRFPSRRSGMFFLFHCNVYNIYSAINLPGSVLWLVCLGRCGSM